MGTVVRIHVPVQCTGACETGMGCDCHPSAKLSGYPAPKAPDQPLMTEPGDLSERPTKPDGMGWITCSLAWLVGFPTCIAGALFLAGQVIDLAKRMIQ